MSLFQRPSAAQSRARQFASRTFVAGALSLAVLGAGVAVGTGCKHSDSSTSSDSTKSLYDRLGGEKAITAVVDDFVNRAAADPAVNFTRKGQPNQWDPTPDNVAKLKKHLTQFVEKAAGGPQEYEGRSNATVHKGMNISESEWNAIVADLKATLAKFNVPQKEQDELINAVAGTHNDVVGL